MGSAGRPDYILASGNPPARPLPEKDGRSAELGVTAMNRLGATKVTSVPKGTSDFGRLIKAGQEVKKAAPKTCKAARIS